MKIPRIILYAVLGLLLVGLSIFIVSWNRRQGSVDIVLQLQDTSRITLDLNGKPQSVTSVHPNYRIKPGHYDLKITKPGYKDFTTSFDVSNQKSTTVNATMVRTDTTTDVSTIAGSIANVTIPGSTVTNAMYFYQKTWAVATITSPDSNTATIIAKYDDQAEAWVVIVGPGTIFDNSSVQNLPTNVVSYLQQNDYINDDTGDN